MQADKSAYLRQLSHVTIVCICQHISGWACPRDFQLKLQGNMTSLGNLSAEILMLIFGQYCLHCKGELSDDFDMSPLKAQSGVPLVYAHKWYSTDRQALFNLCLVNRKFASVAQNILHHELILGYGETWVYTLRWDDRLRSLMRTVARRRDLAVQVKALFVNHRILPINRPYETTRAWLEEPLEIFRDAERVLGVDLREVWRQRALDVRYESRFPQTGGAFTFESFIGNYLSDNGDCDFRPFPTSKYDLWTTQVIAWLGTELIAILIALLPNIEYLGLHSGDHWPKYGFPRNALSGMGISYRAIRKLHLGIEAVRPILDLATDLEELSINGHYGSDLERRLPVMPKVKTLRLVDCHFERNELKRILADCVTGLQRFTYEDNAPSPLHRSWRPNRWDQVQYDQILDFLEPHKSTLRSLHIDLSRRSSHTHPLAPHATLQDFPSLQHLFIDSRATHQPRVSSIDRGNMLVNLMPPSIESFVLKDSYLNREYHTNRRTGQGYHVQLLAEGLRGILDVKRTDAGRLPKLRFVGCDESMQFEEFVGEFEKVGVRLGVDV